MRTDEWFLRMFQVLEEHGVYASEQFYKDIKNLVKTDIEKFIADFIKNFTRENLKDGKKYERLKVTPTQNIRLNGNALFRYEYRNSSNLRCIYMVINGKNENREISLLCAFNEEGDKKTGKNSYSFNIERAIKIYEEK